MKAKVIRNLSGGVYYVSFTFSDFTPEEISKMRSFGVPVVQIRTGIAGSQSTSHIPINQINETHRAGFMTEDVAKGYENSILVQAKTSMEKLRQQKDEFSSTAEVDI